MPRLSQVLEASIDALFGREEQSLTLSLVRKLTYMPNKEAYRYAFDICWAMELGLMQDAGATDSFLDLYADYSSIINEKTPHFGRIMHDGGMATVRAAPDFHHFFLMIEPESGIRAQLSDPESLRRVFALFADKTLLQIIFYLYTRLNTPIATSLISKNTGITIQEVDRYMDILCQNSLVTRTTISTADGDIFSYMFHQESAVIPLLCFADEIARQDNTNFLWSFKRTKPLFESTHG